MAKNTDSQEQTYTADSMRELTGLEPIRQSPSQYIGDTLAVSAKNGRNNPGSDETLTAGGFHLFVETLGNSSDEATNAGADGKPYANLIEIRLHADQSITVTDNGRGVPPDINKATGKSGLEITYLTMNAGGKFKSRTEKKAGNYKTAQGLHGVGAACVAALSDRLDVTVWRNGNEYHMSAKEGIPGTFADDKIRSKFTPITDSSKVVTKVKDNRPAEIKKDFPHGTSVHWHPDPKIWGGTDIPWKDIYDYVNAQSYMAPTCTYRLIDETKLGNGTASKPRITEFHHPGGIADMITEKTEKGVNLSPMISFDVPASYMKNVVIENSDGTMGTEEIEYNCSVKVAMRWTNRNGADIEGYANGVHCSGKHIDGFRRGISRGVGDWIKSANLMTKQDEKKGIAPNIDDITDGMVAVVEVLLEDQCDFHGQTKDILGNSEVLSCVSDAVKDKVGEWFNTRKNAANAKKIGKSIIESARLRAKQKAERETAKKVKTALGGLGGKPAKLCDCRHEGPGTELLICEGQSAGGTIKQARDASNQAAYFVRGVGLNSWGAADAKILANKEFADLVSSMRAGGIGKHFNYDNRRYDRIGIYTDADEDGKNIASLLLVFIYTQFPSMIENQKVFIGCPPLYSITYKSGPHKGETIFAADESERDAFMDDFTGNGGDVSQLKIARAKGLGEMNPDEFRPCLDPRTRKVRIVTVDDVEDARERAKYALALLFSGKKEDKEARRIWIDDTFDADIDDELIDNIDTNGAKKKKIPKSIKPASLKKDDKRDWSVDYADGGKDVIQLGDEILTSMKSFIDYTLTDRALPYIDGLKPVHRATLWYMWDHNIKSTSNYVKSQTIAGGVIGTLHPHSGDAAYGAAAGLARSGADDTKCGACTLNSSLIDGHGNFGASFEDGPAAPRYTEMRLSKSGEACVRDTDSSAVFMKLSFDVKNKLPELLPSRLPILLINGSKGLAYGYNVSWLPHNPAEAIKACLARLENSKCTVKDIRKVMPGPDFPSGGIIVDRDDSAIESAYETGFANLTLTSRYTIRQTTRGRHLIDFYETPYGIARSGDKSILSGIGDFADKHPEYGISDVKNLSGNEHDCLIEVTVKSGINADVVAKALVSPTSSTMLTQTMSYRQSAVIGDFERSEIADATGRKNMLRLANAKPRDIDLIGYIDAFIDFRRACIINSAEFEMDKALRQKHLIDGMLLALVDIDEVISIVRRSQNKDTAAKNLKKRFKLDDAQAAYILGIPLARLTRSDKISLEDNSKKLNARATELKKLLSSEKNIRNEIKNQLETELENQSLQRRTTIVSAKGKILAKSNRESKEQQNQSIAIAMASVDGEASGSVDDESIPSAVSSLTVSGKTSIYMNEAGEICQTDKTAPQLPVQSLRDVDMNDTILIVFRDGSSTRVPAHELPSGKYAKFIKLAAGFASFGQNGSKPVNMAMVTDDGKVKVLDSTTLTNRPDCDVMNVAGGAQVIAARPVASDKEQSFVFVTSKANLLLFPVSSVNSQGRTSAGVAGIKLANGVKVVTATIVASPAAASVVTSTGVSIKVSKLADFPAKGRGTLGVRCHAFLKGENAIVEAYVGEKPAAKNGTKAYALPKVAKRDASGTKSEGLGNLKFGEK